MTRDYMKLRAFLMGFLLLSATVYADVLHIHGIGWNGEQWLIGGRILPDGPTFLVMWDGVEFSPVTVTLPELEDAWIEDISWNGGQWLISASLNGEAHGFAYDGKTVNRIESHTEEYAEEYEESSNSKACNGEFCLIWNSKDKKLLFYNGETYKDVTEESGIQIPFERVILIVSNGQYWLTSFGSTQGGSITKYEQETGFTPLDVPGQTASSAMVWNGSSWLIGTLASPQSSGRLLAYDGTTITDVTPELREALKEYATRENGIFEGEKLLFGVLVFMVVILSFLYIFWRKRHT